MIASFWSGLGGTAALIAAIVWAVLVVFLSLVFVNLFRVLESTKMMIDDLRKETVPLLHEVTGTVSGVNRELDRVDGMLVSAGEIVQRVSRIAGLVEQAASGPIVKIISMGAGLSKAASRLKKKK